MTDLTRLRQLVASHNEATDQDLLSRFVANRDESAFAALVRRHGPMVLSVCRRVLRHRQDAEDAFQATFLVLARRAGGMKSRALLGGWLHGVAYRTAQGALRAVAVRRERETRAAAQRSCEVPPDDGLPDEWREALDREVAALPAMYRAAVVACDLEGLGRSAAAVQLGWSEGTLSSRLARARVLLARRLSRYGLVVPVAGLGTAAAPAVVAAELAEPTVRLGLLLAAGEAVVAAPVATLMEVAMGTMLQTKLKSLAAALAVGCALAVTAAGWRADAAGPGDQPQPAEAPKREARNPDKERIAELERERDLLLKKVADLRARLAVVESALESSAQKEAAAKRAAAEALARAEADLARAEKAASSGSEKEPEIDGKKQSEWIVLLHGEDVAQRQAAVLALAKFGPKAAPDLAAALTDKDLVNVRLWAAHALGQMGPKAKATAPQLAAALKDENGLVRVEAAKALWKVAEDKAAVTALAKTLTDTDATTRYRAAEALGEIGPAAKAAAPALVSALKDDGFAVFGPGPGVVERRPVSKAAAKALKRVDPAAAKEHGIE